MSTAHCLTCPVLLGVLVELEQSIRDGGEGTPQTAHPTLVNGDWRRERVRSGQVTKTTERRIRVRDAL